MWPPHFKLEHAVRSHILELPRYLTSTSDEFEPRSLILLDANENAVGCPFGKAIDTRQDVGSSLPVQSSLCVLPKSQTDPSVNISPSLEDSEQELMPCNSIKRPLDDSDDATINKRRCYNCEGKLDAGNITPSTRTSRETSVDASHVDSVSSASSQVSNTLTLEETVTEDILKALHRYPSTAQLQLKCRIAEWKGILGKSLPLQSGEGRDADTQADIKSICLGVGAAELIDAVIRLTCVPSQDVVLTTPPTFGLYHVRALLNDIGVLECPLRLANDDFELCMPELLETLRINPHVKLIFLASPGNPTGTLISLDAIRQILSCADFHGILVVDEAYIDFSEAAATASAMTLLDEFANLIVLQTTSKTLGLAGLRLGMAFGHPPVIQNLQKIQTPYCIGTPAAALALRVLAPMLATRRSNALALIRANRTALLRKLVDLSLNSADLGTPLGGCEANFVTVPVLAWNGKRRYWHRDSERAKVVTRRLKAEYGIAIRYVGDLHGCVGCIRITVGLAAENALVCEALRVVLLREKSSA